MAKLKRVILVTAFAMLVVALVSAEENYQQRASLSGLYGVHIEVLEFTPEVKKTGLTEHELTTCVELRLRQLHIRVLTKDEWRKAQGMPCLSLNVYATSLQEGNPLTCLVLLQHCEWMRQIRKPFKPAVGAVWQSSLPCFGSPEDIKSKVLKCVDEYANDYLAANANRK